MISNNFNNKKYQDFFNKYKLAYTNNVVNGIENKTNAKIQLEVNDIWKQKIKKSSKEDIDMESYGLEMKRLNMLLEKK